MSGSVSVGSNRSIQIALQDGPKVTPAGKKFYRLRDTGGSGLANAATVLESDEIRSDRGIAVSRKGQNAPDAEVNYELSWKSYDHLLQGALGGQWQGGVYLDAVAEGLTISTDTAGVFTLVNDRWSEYGIHAGDYILVEGDTDIPYLVALVGSIVYDEGEAEDKMTLVDFAGDPIVTVATSEDMSFTTGHYGASLTGITLTETEGVITIAGTEGLWKNMEMRPGDSIQFNGFTTPANNQVWFKVADVETTAGVITVTTEAEGITTEATADVTVITNTGFLTVSTNLDYFTYVENFSDVTTGNDVDGNAITTNGASHWSVGNRVSSMNMSIQVDSLITGSFMLMGMEYSGFKATPLYTQNGNTVVSPNNEQVFDSFTGELSVPDAPAIQGVVTGINFDVDNNTDRKYVLMQRNAMAVGEGRSNISGTMEAFFSNPEVSNLFENEVEFEVYIRMDDLNENSYAFIWPRCKLESDSRSVTENDVTSSFGIRMLYGNSEKIHTMAILRQPAVG